MKLRHAKLLIMATAALTTASAGTTIAAAAPIKMVLSSRFGDAGVAASEFKFLAGVAGATAGNFYVADGGNHRVQVFGPSGEFVMMFGRKVNKAGGDTCMAVEAANCQTGEAGAAAGQLFDPLSIAVDPASGDLYVAEFVELEISGKKISGERVQKFTPEGQFLLEIGKEVNINKTNLCASVEIENCVGPAAPTGPEHGAFNFASSASSLLAVGGAKDLVYVGNEQSVQEFNSGGDWVGGITEGIKERVMTVTLDQETGAVALVEELGSTIHVFDGAGKLDRDIQVKPQSGGEVHVLALGTDNEGRLATVAREVKGSLTDIFGRTYVIASGEPITEFEVPVSFAIRGMGFNGEGRLYLTADEREVLIYDPKHVAEPNTQAATCQPGATHGTNLTFDCVLNGNVDPWGVTETEAWFQWDRTPSLGEETTKQAIPSSKAEGEEEPPVPIGTTITSVRPNETFYYRLATYDHNVQPPERPVTSSIVSFSTPVTPPWVGQSSALFITASSAVIFGELNPENADTQYTFEYAPGEELKSCPSMLSQCPSPTKASCAGVATTPFGEAETYGQIGATLEATSLQPDTEYRYRLFAESESRSKTERCTNTGPEGHPFRTALAATPRVRTGPATDITSASAIIAGEVDPDGLPASYAFEIGIYAGAETQYGRIFSGSVGASKTAVPESLTATGLQPGTTYAYRITISSGYVNTETHTLAGETMIFTTLGLPAVLQVPEVRPQLSVPPIGFRTSLISHKLTNRQLLPRALKKCSKMPKRKRTACRRRAMKKYATQKAR